MYLLHRYVSALFFAKFSLIKKHFNYDYFFLNHLLMKFSPVEKKVATHNNVLCWVSRLVDK
jgi:hypothetical protein